MHHFGIGLPAGFQIAPDQQAAGNAFDVEVQQRKPRAAASPWRVEIKQNRMGSFTCRLGAKRAAVVMTLEVSALAVFRGLPWLAMTRCSRQ
jgi:hypothetical protein